MNPKRLLVRVPHEEMDVDKLLRHLSEDVVRVYFRKKTNGRFRSIYPFTRRIDLVPFRDQMRVFNLLSMEMQNPPIEQNIKNNRGYLVKGYSLLESSWKSFYTNNVLWYEVYDMEGDTLE